MRNVFPKDWGKPVSLYTMSNNGFYSKLYFAMNSLEHRLCVTCTEAFIHLQTKSLLNKLFVYNFHNIYFPKTIPSKILYICSSLIHKHSKHLLLLASCFDPIIRKEHQYFRSPQNILAWENSRHFVTPPLVSPRNDVWETMAEIPYWSVRNIPKFKDRTNRSRDTFQPMRRRACVYQQTNQNVAPVIKNFRNSGRSRTESVIVSRLLGIFLRLFMRHTQLF